MSKTAWLTTRYTNSHRAIGVKERTSQTSKWSFIMAQTRSASVLSCFSCVQLFATPWTVAYQAPLSMEFSRQEYWSELPFPSPGESSQTRDQTWISCIAGAILYCLSHQRSSSISIYQQQATGTINSKITFIIASKPTKCQENT